MLDDLAGKRTGERIQILRERKGLSRPVLAGLVGMSASWLKGIEQGRRLPPRLPVLVKLAEALAVGDVAVLAGTDMDLGGATSVPVASFARIPHAMTAAQEADDPAALAGAAWTLGMVQRSAGDTDGALSLALDAAALLEPLAEDGTPEVRALAGAMYLHAATTCARGGREGGAWRHWDTASGIADRLPDRYHHPWTMFGSSNVALHAVSLSADLSKSADARAQAEQIDPDEIPSRERRGRLAVEIARSYHQRRDYTATLHWLEHGYQTSADSVRYSPTARQMTADTVDHGGALISRRARSLAGSLGLPPTPPARRPVPGSSWSEPRRLNRSR
jgi:transcriptional regulator with XRE-family HTH domain